MTISSTRLHAALCALLLLCFAGPCAWASDRIETIASVSIVRSAAVTVVNNTPLQTVLLTTAMVPPGVTFTAGNAGAVTVGASRGGPASGATTGGVTSDAGTADTGGAGLPAADGGSAPELVAVGGSLGSTTINGDAVSVSVGNVSGGSAAGSGRVPMVIAQYN